MAIAAPVRLHRASTPDLTVPGTDIRIVIAEAFSLLPPAPVERA